jgi:thiopurine S-methyltransferase
MEHNFWHERWQMNQIGFHRDEIHPHLQQYGSKLGIKSGGRVFVPMCGKTNDMLWLLKQGFQVLGIELSPLAVAAFFAENDLQANIRQQGEFLSYEMEGLQILCGDFFALQPDDAGKIDAVYDRGALVALPAQMRLDYAAKMAQLLKCDVNILLVALNYPQVEMSGPPFSLSPTEIAKLYQAWCEIDLLANEDVLAQEAALQKRGLTQLHEQVYRLVVK